jgi:hypothetical protein
MDREPFDPLAYRDPRPSPALIRSLEPLNQRLLLPWVMKVRQIDLPAADEQRLRAAVRPDTAAFLGPNHPEFLTDWLIDKELSRRVGPRMAHWAAREIVNRSAIEQSFWLANNLIANVPGGGGKAYSVQWAMAGNGVLLHPEGQPTWHPGHVAPLMPGIVEMAWDTAEALQRASREAPVYLVPIVWWLRFTRDAEAGLQREMAHFERALGLRHGGGMSLEKRFEALLWGILQRRCEFFGFTGPAGKSVLAPRDYFQAQIALTDLLMDILTTRFGAQSGDLDDQLQGFRRAIRKEWEENPLSVHHDRKRLKEIERLRHFSRPLYDKETLSQEEIAACLKQLRSVLLPNEVLRNMVPIAVAPRIAHVRVLEPIEVHRRVAATNGAAEAARATLLAELRTRMQTGLDALDLELSARRAPKRHPNPLWSRNGDHGNGDALLGDDEAALQPPQRIPDPVKIEPGAQP